MCYFYSGEMKILGVDTFVLPRSKVTGLGGQNWPVLHVKGFVGNISCVFFVLVGLNFVV